MNGVPPAGPYSTTGRTQGDKFLSQSENDVAEAFAALLREEGIADPPASTPSPATSSPASNSATREEAPRSDSSPRDAASSGAATGSSSVESDRERDQEREDEDAVALNGAAAVVSPTTLKQEPSVTVDADAAEGELEPILSELQALAKTLAAGQAPTAEETSDAASSAESTKAFVETLAAKTADEAAVAETTGEAVAEAPPNVAVVPEPIEVEPLRRSESKSDGDGSFAIDLPADDASDADVEALAALAAEQAAADADPRDPSTDARDGKDFSPERTKEDPAAVERAAEGIVAPTFETVAATGETNHVATGVDPASALQATTPNERREEATNSLLRAAERPREAGRNELHGVDRSRFLDRVERAFKAAEQGDGSIRMRLHPADLGSIQLTLEKGAGGEWIARLEAESPHAKQALLEHAGALRERLADQEFRVARFEVETPDDRQQREARDSRENPQSFSRSRDRRDDERADEDRPGDSAPRAEADGSRRLDVRV